MEPSAGFTAPSASHALLVLLFCWALVTDLKAMKIPNILTVSGMAAGFVYHTAAANGLGFTFSLLGCLCGAGLLFPLYLMGALGAGDVKMFGAAGAIAGAQFAATCIFYSILYAGAEALLLIGYWKMKRMMTGENKLGRRLEFPFMAAAVPGAVTAYAGMYI